MTDRLKGAWVVFDKDYREDDAGHIINAIKMVRGVAAVEPKLTDVDDYFARSAVLTKFRSDFLALFKKLGEV